MQATKLDVNLLNGRQGEKNIPKVGTQAIIGSLRYRRFRGDGDVESE